MQQELLVKNGTIILPRELSRAWAGLRIKVSYYPGRVILEVPDNHEGRLNLKQWKRAAGILKRGGSGTVTPDPLIWQRKIRGEWDRKLP